MAVRNGSGAILNGSRRVLKQGEAPEGAREDTSRHVKQREAKLKQRRIGELERQPQERVPTGDHPEHNPQDHHRIQRDEAESRPFSNDHEGPAVETAARGVRRRISKKRAAKADQPWEAPLNPDEFDSVQWPGDMGETEGEQEDGPPLEPGTVVEDKKEDLNETVDLQSDEEVEMHTRGEPGSILAQPDPCPEIEEAIKRSVRQAHKNLGHPHRDTFVRMLRRRQGGGGHLRETVAVPRLLAVGGAEDTTTSDDTTARRVRLQRHGGR